MQKKNRSAKNRFDGFSGNMTNFFFGLSARESPSTVNSIFITYILLLIFLIFTKSLIISK